MAVVAKKDIESLTKQLRHEKFQILEAIKKEYVEIEPSILCDVFVQEIDKKLRQVFEAHLDTGEAVEEDVTISLNDVEAIASRFDNLEKKLLETKAVPKNKENHNVKRCGSMTDINKPMMRSTSTLNLSTVKTFVEPQAPTLRSAAHCGSAFASDNTNNENLDSGFKLTSDQLSEHNSIMKQIQTRLDHTQSIDNEYEIVLKDISQRYKTSFQRLNKFADEIQKIQSDKIVETGNQGSLENLDKHLLDLMENLIKVLFEVRFITDNQNIYSLDGIKTVSSMLSHDLTDILEHFYRAIN